MTAAPIPPRNVAALGERYTLERELGRGGMERRGVPITNEEVA
jgi:hypothetical protein